MNLTEKVKDAIERQGLLRPQGRVVVTVSGGADSVALLSVLLELGYDCLAAHCNFGLRGAESVRDMRHVESLADRLGVDLCVRDFDVAARRADTGESVEMACRELRYEWFYELVDRERAQAIAVGHHAEDQLETLFLNLLRGTGITGLRGMRPRNGHVVRPMLECTRAEIEAYLRARGLDWVTDSTNVSDDFTRNRLRNRLLPLVDELFDGARAGLHTTINCVAENAAFYDEAVDRLWQRYVHAGEVDLMALQRDEPHAALLLFEWLRGEGFSRRQTDDMLRAAAAAGGEFHSRRSHSRRVDHGILRAPAACFDAPADSEACDVTLTRDIFRPVRITVTRHHVTEFKPSRDPRVIYIDARAVDTPHRWQMRPWRRGDRMRPYGMDGTRLVSDIFASARLSAARKQAVRLLTCDDDIVWVTGIRASGLFTIGPDTKEFVKLRLEEKI